MKKQTTKARRKIKPGTLFVVRADNIFGSAYNFFRCKSPIEPNEIILYLETERISVTAFRHWFLGPRGDKIYAYSDKQINDRVSICESSSTYLEIIK